MNNRLVKLIKWILYYPKLFILLPMLVVFLLGYNVNYDFTAMKINTWIRYNYFSNYHTQSPWYISSLNYTCNYEKDFIQLDKLRSSTLNNVQLSQITFGADNVLTYESLDQIRIRLEQFTKSTYGPLIIVSPLLDWNLNLAVQVPYHYILSAINYHSDLTLNSLFIDEIQFTNHLVEGAKKLHVYVVSKSSVDVEAFFSDQKVTTVTQSLTIKEFLDYYLFIHRHGIAALITFILKIIISLVLVYFSFHTYLSISNLHRVKSSFGIMFGWVIEISVSITASVNLFRLLYGYEFWEQVFHPSTFFTRASAYLALMSISSRNLIRLILDLSNCEDYSSTGTRRLQTRLYKFYVGISNNEEVKYDKLDIIAKFFRLNNSKFSISIPAPKISKILLLDILTLKGVHILTLFILKIYYKGQYLQFLVTKLSRFTNLICFALVIDHLLQLTFLVGTILVDNYRRDITTILNNNEKATEYNCLSYLLLKNNPPRDSFRFKLGTSLAFVRYPINMKSWLVLLLLVQLLNVFIALSHWAVSVPYNLFRETDLFKGLTISHLSFDCFYYLECIAFKILIIALSFIVFRFSDFKVVEDDSSKIELYDNKNFKYIDMKGSHHLDIIKLKSNNSPFLISVGLDHKVLVWSPLDLSQPIDLSSTIGLDDKNLEFWPINFVNMSSNGEFIILVNYKFKLIRCYSRSLGKFNWTSSLDVDLSSDKILESFFRERTVPGFLQLKKLKHSRTKSDASINGNFQRLDTPPVLDFVIVFESGEVLTFACDTGALKSTSNVFEEIYEEEDGNEANHLRLRCAKKLITPRVNDRIIYQVNNKDLIVSIAVNNKWRFIKLDTTDGKYNKEVKILDTPMSRGNSNFASSSNNFASIASSVKSSINRTNLSDTGSAGSQIEINKPIIAALEFVGMIIRVNSSVAELIDVQSGYVLHKINVGHFKSLSFRVAHLEPTHCKFCGCVSIKSLSVMYEDFNTNTLLVHTFKVLNTRSRTNICLRVERDPREIRCAGFDNVVEEQHWYENITAWEVTDTNIVIGVKNTKDEFVDDHSDEEISESQGKLRSLKSNKKKQTKKDQGSWEGFIITLLDGKQIPYGLPNMNNGLIFNKVNCIEKFGFKSVAVSFGDAIKILYLGNDKLIEENLYFNDLNNTKAINNELLFINKRRKR